MLVGCSCSSATSSRLDFQTLEQPPKACGHCRVPSTSCTGRLKAFLKTFDVSSKVLTAIHDIMKLVLLTCWHLPGFARGLSKSLLQVDGRASMGWFHWSSCEDATSLGL